MDVSGRPLQVHNRYKIPTELSGTEHKIVWWEMDTDTKPIIGMDSFDRLGLQLFQREKVQSENPTEVMAIQRQIDKERQRESPHSRTPKNISHKQSALTNPNSSPKKQESNEHADSNDHKQAQIQKRIAGQFPKLFSTNTTVHNFKYHVQYKENMEIIQQKGRRVSIHIQTAVENEVDKLLKQGHIEKLTEIGEDIFVSPVVITRKSDGTVKIALDSVQLNRQIVKKTMQMPLLSELLDRVSIQISGNRNAKLNVSTIDLEYAFGQIDLHKETSKHCVAAIVGGKATGHY